MRRDYLKLVILQKYGGIYAANNYVCLKSFSPLVADS